MKTIARMVAIVFTAGWLALSGSARAEDGAARELVKAMLDQAKVSFSARMKLTSPGGLVRELEVRHFQDGETSATYMEIVTPFNMKDTRFLSWDRENGKDEHYMFVPMLRRSVQVPSWTLNQPFLGSNFYMTDIAFPDMAEFKYVLAGDGTANGQPCHNVDATPDGLEDYPYSKIVYCIDPRTFLSLHTEFFDLDGQLMKVWEPQKIENIENVWTPLSQTMRDVQKSTESRLEVLEIHQHQEFAPEIFSKAHLDR